MNTRLRHGGLAFAAVVSSICAAHTVLAEEVVPWDLTPHVGLTQIYTDNIALSRAGEEEHEYITQADVGFNLNRKGGRAEANLAYNLQGLAYWRENRRNTIYHQFSGDGQVELLPERFFLDAATTYSQRFISRDTGVAPDNINPFGNRSDVFTLQITPTYIQRLGNFATGQLRYTYDRVDYRESEADNFDSESNRVLARLDSGTWFSRIGWELSYRRDKTDFKDGSSVTLQTAEALLRWNVTDRFSLFAAGGEEDNEFVQDPGRARPDDTFWRAGATWQPGTRTNMEAYYGERFFGKTYGGSLEHRFRHSQFTLDYNEGLTTVNGIQLQQVVVPVVDDTGLPVIVDGQPVFLVLEIPDLQSGVFLRKRFSAGFSGERSKTSWGLYVFNERREFEVDDRRERVQGVSANVAWRVAARTRLLLNGSVQKSTYEDIDREDNYYRIGTGVLRDIGPRTTGSLNYRHVELNSNQDVRDYRENRISVSFRKRF